MSTNTRTTQPRFLPAFLAAVCGLAIAAPSIAQSDNPFAAGDVTPDNVDVNVTEHLTVDLHVQDEELANVLQILSLQSQKNILVSGDVSATVNANLYNVTFYEALTSILNVNGYGYVEKGSFIYVYTLEEIAELEQAAREPVTRVLRLNYLNANDAAEFVAPLLSEVGSIKSNGDVDAFSIPDGNPTGDETYALSSTLVIYDYPEHIDEIETLLADLDTRPAQVLVEATILETSLREMNGFGVDFSFISDLDFTDFIDIGGPLATTRGLIAGGDGTADGISPPGNQAISGTSSAGNTAAGPATFKLGIIDDNISVFLRALDDITDVTVLSRPKVMALNRQPARVLVGRRIGYLSTTSTETATTQTVEFLDTGTQLKFRAFVGNDGFIRMELHPSTSTGETRDAAGATGAAVTIPEEVTQEITTNVLVRDGSTVVLGGLFRESTTLSRRQVPILGDLPIIGAAFKGHDDDTRRSEIIFMITPTIVNDQILTQDGEIASDYVENVRTGTRAGLLPFSRDRQSAELNVKAERAAIDGDPAKGLFLLRRSLELNPNQPDAIRLREQLLQQQNAFPSRSVLEDIFDEELNDRISQIESIPAKEAREQQLAEVQDDSVVIAGPEANEAAEMTLSLPPEQQEFFIDPDATLAEVDETNEFESEIFDLEPPVQSAFSEDENNDFNEFNNNDDFNTLNEDFQGEDITPEITESDFEAAYKNSSDHADKVFDNLIQDSLTQIGETMSPATSPEDDLFNNLRLTVTVAPGSEEPVEPTPRTSVTLTPEAAYSDSYPKPTPSFTDRLADSDDESIFYENQNNSDDFFTPEEYSGSTLAGLESEEDESSEFDAETGTNNPGLIGPAFAGADLNFESQSFDQEFGENDAPIYGGFWLWFRDTVVLDTSEINLDENNADEAVAGTDPDKD